MSRSIFISFLAATFLVAPAAVPSAFVSAIAPGLSGSAQAAKNLNSSRSNIYRTKKTGSTKQSPKDSKAGTAPRMGGGGGGRSGGY
jgi:hypothetical protein